MSCQLALQNGRTRLVTDCMVGVFFLLMVEHTGQLVWTQVKSTGDQEIMFCHNQDYFSNSTYTRNQNEEPWDWKMYTQYDLFEPMSHQCPTVYSHSNEGENFMDYLCELQKKNIIINYLEDILLPS